MAAEEPTSRRRVRARKATPSLNAATADSRQEPPKKERQAKATKRVPGQQRRSPAAPAVSLEGLPRFQDLYFGAAAAENEVAVDATRFRATYLDRYLLPSKVAAHESFLILGPKGSGKSAAALFVAESWKHELGEDAVFVETVDFDELNRT